MKRIITCLVGLAAMLAVSTISAGAQNYTSSSIRCNKSVIYDTNTNGSTQLVAAGRPIYICGYIIRSGAAVNVDLRYGTGTACATGATAITPAYVFTTTISAVQDGSASYRGLVAPAGNALCINSSAGAAVQAIVHYAQ